MLAVAAIAVFVIATLIGITWWLSLIVVVTVAVAVGLVVPRRAPDMVIRKLHAVPADVNGRHERLAHLVEGLCLSNGLREPALAVVDDAGVNGLVVEMPDGNEAKEAIDKVNLTEIAGRKVTVNEARPRADRPRRGGGGGGGGGRRGRW